MRRPPPPTPASEANLRALDYGRVSTRGQKEVGHSLETQAEANAALIREKGWRHIGHVEEDASGLTMDRAELDRIREMIENDELDVLVVYELDRLSRRPPHQYILRDEMKKHNVQLWYAKSWSKSGETKEELLGENVLALVAEVEVEKTAERTRRGRRKKAQKGMVVGAGVPPYGYEYRGYQHERQIYIVEAQAEVVRLVFRLYVEERTPVLQVAEELTRRHIPTPGDDDQRVQKRGKIKRHRGPCEWGISSVYRILRQRAYIGEFVHYAHTMQEGHLRVNQDTETQVIVPVPPIITDRALWEAAQDKIDSGRGLSLRNSRANDLLLARVFKCDCGRAYQIQRTVHDGISFTYYRCWGRLPAGGRVCKRPHLKARVLEPFVWDWMISTALNPVWLGEHLRADSHVAETKRKRADSDKERLAERLVKEERKLRNLRNMLADEDITQEEYRDDRAEVLRAIDGLKTEMAKLDIKAERVYSDEQIEYAQQRAADIRDGVEEAGPVEQRIVTEQFALRAELEEQNGVLGIRLHCIFNEEWKPLPEDEDRRGTHRDGRRGGRKKGSKNKPKGI